MTRNRRFVLLAAGFLSLAMAFLQVSFPSEQGAKASRQIAQSATVVYVSLRAINAALSISQEIEVGASVGASASAQPLKVLEPVDDTIERIAGVVFAIAAASWVLSVAFQPVSVLGFALLGVGLVSLAVGARWPAVLGPARVATRFGLVLAMMLPLLYAGGVALGRVATENLQAEATATLNGVAGEARKLIRRTEGAEEPTIETGAGWLSGLWDGVSQVGDQVSRFTNAADYYWTNADAVLGAAFALIAVFVLRILVMPLLLLILLWRLLGSVR